MSEGTRLQQKTKRDLSLKQAALKKKYNTFQKLVNEFNEKFPSAHPIACLDFDNIKQLPVFDPFWDIGNLTHPTEAWAIDKKTKEGIVAYRDKIHAFDELRRVGRECRQAIKWALDMDTKLLLLETRVGGL